MRGGRSNPGLAAAQILEGAAPKKRVAAPMVGGLVTSFALELLVYPALFAFWKGRGLSPQPSRVGSEPM